MEREMRRKNVGGREWVKLRGGGKRRCTHTHIFCVSSYWQWTNILATRPNLAHCLFCRFGGVFLLDVEWKSSCWLSLSLSPFLHRVCGGDKLTEPSCADRGHLLPASKGLRTAGASNRLRKQTTSAVTITGFSHYWHSTSLISSLHYRKKL